MSIVLRDRRDTLPEFVAQLGRVQPSEVGRISPLQLRAAVLRLLHVGPWRPSCLVNALVLYRLLREQGDPAEVVIGLPIEAVNHDAHAWVELHGEDLGPFPGRPNHSALARFN
ncbi:MAG: lasso peptide biosynthesis B2 protein [Acidimicrobiia bacterium]